MGQEDQEKGLPLIPCVYCSHANPPGFRFCGMCGKALPDLVKQAARSVAATPAPKAVIAQPAPAPRTAAAAPRVDQANRDLSYLLHDDHQPVRPNRTPWIVGGLLLAAVAAFFVMRGGGKPAVSSVVTDQASASQPADPAAGTDSATAIPPVETKKAESPASELNAEPKPEPTPEPKIERKPEPVRSAPTPIAHVRAPMPPVRKPSPARAAANTPDEATPSSIATAGNDDCEKRLPALRRAAASGSARARADLGLVYYVGRCVPRDLPTAYRFYALALRTEPDSPLVSAQLEAIWKQMSPAERQLAQKPQ